MYSNSSNNPSVYFENELNVRFNKMLAEYNTRNTSITDQKIYVIRTVLNNNLTESVSLKFGGSLSKNTYIDGISDFDILVYINNTELSSKTPRSAIDNIRNKLINNKKADMVDISVGQMAVTIKYQDNTVIQLLPALKDSTGFRLPSANGAEWSNVIMTGKFVDDLISTNQRYNGKILSIIKLVKIINSYLSDNQKLKGYHIEAMALDIFYNSPNTNASTRVMIEEFYERAKERVISPITDRTNQSKYVDNYLGEPNSPMRRDMSNILNTICSKMRNADRIESINEWESLLGFNKN